MYLFAGSSHPALAQELAKELDTELGEVDLKAFSCGEKYVRYRKSVRGKDVYILQTSGPNPNENLMELFLMCQAAKLGFAKSIHVILPNFPYARQDRVADWREPISAKLVASLLEEAGADHVMTMALHSDQIQGFFSVPVDAVDTSQIFADYLAQKNLTDPVIVAPDVGSAKDSKKFADVIGAELVIMHKTRKEHQQAEILDIVGDVESKTCILFDDMIDTAGTLSSAKQALVERGANPDVYAMATHAIFSGPAYERLQEAQFKEIVVSNTLPVDKEKIESLHIVSVAPLLAKIIQQVIRGESVTEIYKNK